MKNPLDLDDAERRHLANHPLCVAARRRAEDAANAFFRSIGGPNKDPIALDAAIEVLSTAGLDIMRAEPEALEAFRVERGNYYLSDG